MITLGDGTTVLELPEDLNGWQLTELTVEPDVGPCWYRHRWVMVVRVGLVSYYHCTRCSARKAMPDKNSGKMQMDLPWVMGEVERGPE